MEDRRAAHTGALTILDPERDAPAADMSLARTSVHWLP